MQNLQKTKFTKRALLLPVYLPAFLLSFSNGIITPTLPLYAKSFHTSLSLVGLVVAMSAIGVLIADVPAGILLERIGRKPSMIIGVAIVALSTLGIGLARTLFELMIYQLIGGVGEALWGASRHAYMTDVIPIPERGRSLALFGGIGRIGAFAGPVVGGYLGERYGLRFPFFIHTAVAAITSILCIFFIVETKRFSAIGFHQLHWERFETMLKAHYRSFSTAGSAHICVQALRTGRRIIISLYGTDIGLDIKAVGWVFSISSFVDMSLFYPAGVIMDRFGRRYTNVSCALIFATGMAMMPFARGFTSLLIASIVMGIGNGFGSGAMMTLGADLAPKEGRGEFLGIWRLIGDVGGMTGPLVVGNIAEVWSLGGSAFALAGIGYIAVAIFLWLVPETLQQDKGTGRKVEDSRNGGAGDRGRK
jgi:MFS family permease